MSQEEYVAIDSWLTTASWWPMEIWATVINVGDGNKYVHSAAITLVDVFMKCFTEW